MNYLNYEIILKNEYDLEAFLESNKTQVLFLGFIFKNKEILETTDLCLFKKFPHLKGVFPIPDLHDNYIWLNCKIYLNCSCTLIWLLKHSERYAKFFKFEYKSSFDEFFSDTTNFDIPLSFIYNYSYYETKCKFDKLFKNCKIEYLDIKINNKISQFEISYYYSFNLLLKSFFFRAFYFLAYYHG